MSKFDSQSYNRNKSSDSSPDQESKGTDKLNIIEQEVKKMFKSGAGNITLNELNKLREKYRDEKIVDEIYDAYYAQLKKVTKRAKKFAKVILRKYHNIPLHKALKKAIKYKKHYKLSDAEFTEFQRIYEQQLVGYQDNTGLQRYERTRIGRTLGDVPISETEPLRVSDKELVVLQEILVLYAQTKMLHSQIMVQSITYRDCAPEALTGKLHDANGNIGANPANHVHPIIAAMFLPKINILDEHMLFANIAHIIKSKHEKRPIVTRPDYELYYDLITDPNDIVCDVESPLTDLRNRCILQKDIWDAVLNLRNGRYYQHNMTNFLTAVDNCRMNIYDTPDLVYVKDEGAILRRILSAFSFRPTVVSTMPISHLEIENNPYSRPPVIANVTAIPMVTLRLPLHTQANTTAIHLNDSLTQAHWYMEHTTIVPKQQAIIYSRGVLFFYVNRRYQSINVATMMRPHNFTRLPMTLAGFEKLNTKSVNFKDVMEIMTDKYNLRSVVLVDTAANNANCPSNAATNLIVGTTAEIMLHPNLARGITQTNYWLYDPLRAALKQNDQSSFDPIMGIDGERPIYSNNNVETFHERARKRGSIFIYQKVSDGASTNPFYNEDCCY